MKKPNCFGELLKDLCKESIQAMNDKKRIVCFFIKDNGAQAFTKQVDPSDINCESSAIQSVIEEQHINPYNLSFVLDDDRQTYKAEYLHSLQDFQTRKKLLHMETNIVKPNEEARLKQLNLRHALRHMSEEAWIEKHASGTLRKNRRIGFSFRAQYLAERVAYEFGYGFQILPRSQVTFGDAISEEDCHPITEAGWHIERYSETNVLGDFVEAKYIHATYRDNSMREGVGMIVRETSASWLPIGHIVFSIVAEFDPIRKAWLNAVNPF